MRTAIVLLSAFFSCAAVSAIRAEDTRELVQLPDLMRENVLADMRNHLTTLSRIMGYVTNGKYDEAAKIAKQELQMTSLSSQGADDLARLPKPMQDIDTTMQLAASRMAIALQDASTAPTANALRGINRTLYEVTVACEACHTHYRLR